MTFASTSWLPRRGFLAALTALAALVCPQAGAQDKTWGPKTVQITVGFAPGGGVDLLARMIATELQKGLVVVVENRPGAGSTLAAGYVAGRPNDGSALFMMNDSYALAPAIYPKLAYDPKKDLAPVIGVAYAPMVVLVPAQSPHKSMADLMAASRSTLSWGSCGSGTAPHLAGEMLNISLKTKNTHVPYKGCGPALVDLLGGQLDYGVVTVSGALGHIRTGKLRAVAITSAQRAPFLPDLPTVAESGASDFQLSQWQGLAVPATVPEPLRQRIYEAVAEVMQTPEVQKRLLELGYTPANENPAQFQKVVHADIDRMNALAKRLNLKVD